MSQTPNLGLTLSTLADGTSKTFAQYRLEMSGPADSNMTKIDQAFGDHTGNTDIHLSETERSTWNAKASTAVATTSTNGLMSSTDKTKLDGVATNANNYSHPTGDGNLHVPATGTSNNGKVLKAGATAGSFSWNTLAKGDVGLGSVDNTSDLAKPISTATQNALDLKAPKDSPTFTGTVGGITAAMVGLGNVTNESKATMFTSPVFTGNLPILPASNPTTDNQAVRKAYVDSATDLVRPNYSVEYITANSRFEIGTYNAGWNTFTALATAPVVGDKIAIYLDPQERPGGEFPTGTSIYAADGTSFVIGISEFNNDYGNDIDSPVILNLEFKMGAQVGNMFYNKLTGYITSSLIEMISLNNVVGAVEGFPSSDLSSNLKWINFSFAKLDSPTFTGTPAAPTAPLGTNTTQLATTAYVQGEASASAILTKIKTVDGAGSGLDADLLGGVTSENYATRAYADSLVSDVVAMATGTGTITTTGWLANTGDYPLKLHLAISGILEADSVDVFINNDDQDVAQDAELSPNNDSYAGGITFYAKSVPTAPIGFSYRRLR